MLKSRFKSAFYSQKIIVQNR